MGTGLRVRGKRTGDRGHGTLGQGTWDKGRRTRDMAMGQGTRDRGQGTGFESFVPQETPQLGSR